MSGTIWRRLDASALRHWPLPDIDGDADKEERGRVVVVGGTRDLAGAVQLAGIAALRAGAGKLVLAAARSACAGLVQAVPEARVIGCEEGDGPSLRPALPGGLDGTLRHAAAVLVGPGLASSDEHAALATGVLDACRETPVVLDAGAMDVVARLGRFTQPVLLTPHAGEMAHLLGCDKDDVATHPERCALEAASRWNAVVALKGAVTLIATPRGDGWRHESRKPGLATSGSGDVLSGLVLGFAARGAPLAQACAWGVVLHALAGEALARRVGPIGFLARELAGEVPALLRKLDRPRRGR